MGMSGGMQNPLIPQFPMNLYGFGGIPANLIPGFNPNLLNTMALMQQAAVANAANQAAANRDSDTVNLDDELEEGEISPPDTPTLPVMSNPPKRDRSPDIEIIEEKKDLKKEDAETSGGKVKKGERSREGK